jgi:hypothetical protein
MDDNLVFRIRPTDVYVDPQKATQTFVEVDKFLVTAQFFSRQPLGFFPETVQKQQFFGTTFRERQDSHIEGIEGRWTGLSAVASGALGICSLGGVW